MGLSTSKQKTSTTYGKDALPNINAATSGLTNAYNTSKGLTDKVTGTLGGLFDNYDVSNPTLDAASGYTNDVLGGKYLDASNPYLQGVVNTTNESVADRVNALFSKSGQTGSSRQIGELGKQLSAAENNLRYQAYGDERDRMDAAVGNATNLNSANNSNIQTQATLGQLLSSLGLDNAATYAGGIGSLWGNNTTTTQKSSQGLGSILAGLGGTALAGWASGGFK